MCAHVQPDHLPTQPSPAQPALPDTHCHHSLRGTRNTTPTLRQTAPPRPREYPSSFSINGGPSLLVQWGSRPNSSSGKNSVRKNQAPPVSYFPHHQSGYEVLKRKDGPGAPEPGAPTARLPCTALGEPAGAGALAGQQRERGGATTHREAGRLPRDGLWTTQPCRDARDTHPGGRRWPRRGCPESL